MLRKLLASAFLCSMATVNPLAAAETGAKLGVTGSSTVAPLLSEIAKRYEQSHPQVRIDVQTGGSSRGIADARSGLADIGMASRALKTDEAQELKAHVLALDGVCFLVHRDNPVIALSDAQILDIYLGKTRNWKALGGKDAPITVVNRAEGRSELELFAQYFKIKSDQIKPDLVVGENQQGIKTVAGDPNAIVYLSVGTSEYEKALGTPIKLLPLNGIAASVATVKDGSFPMSRPLILVTRETPTGVKKDFIDFARSSAVHDLVREQSFVPVDQGLLTYE